MRARLLPLPLGALTIGALLLACGPRAHRGDEPLILETDTRHAAPAPIETVEIPRIRTGMIARTTLNETLDAGVGYFLGSLDVTPHLQNGQFAGWVVQRFDNPWVDLVPGDIVKAVNGARIETPAQVQSLWLKLKGAEQILVSVIRGEAAFELRFTIQGAAQAEGS